VPSLEGQVPHAQAIIGERRFALDNLRFSQSLGNFGRRTNWRRALIASFVHWHAPCKAANLRLKSKE
jgi:hypothetical protein